MDHKQLIDDLGGAHALHSKLAARGLPLKPVSVRAWELSDRAIPAKYWLHIREIAAAEGVEVDFEKLAEGVAARAA